MIRIPSAWVRVAAAFLVGVSSTAAHAQPVNASPQTSCVKHVIVLYDASGTVLGQSDLVRRTNLYLHALLFSGPPQLTDGADYVQSNALSDRGIPGPLLTSGDCFSFMAFGMETATLRALGEEADQTQFWAGFSRSLLHPSGLDRRQVDPALAAAVQTTLDQHARRRGWFGQTLSHYVLPAIASRLPTAFSKRILIVRVSDLFSGPIGANENEDRAIIARLAPRSVGLLDAALTDYDRVVDTDYTLYRLRVGSVGIKIHVMEIEPRDALRLRWSSGSGVARQIGDDAWSIVLPRLTLDSIDPRLATGLRWVAARAELRIPGQPSSVIPLPSLTAPSPGASVELHPVTWPEPLPLEHTTGSTLTFAWQVDAILNEAHGFRIPLFVETEPLALDVELLPPPVPLWGVAAGATAGSGALLLLLVRRACKIPPELLTRAGWLPDGAKPDRLKTGRWLWPVTQTEGNRRVDLAVYVTRPRLARLRRTRFRLDRGSCDPLVNDARLGILLPTSGGQVAIRANEEFCPPYRFHHEAVPSFWVTLDISSVRRLSSNDLAGIEFSILNVETGATPMTDGFLLRGDRSGWVLAVDPGTTACCAAIVQPEGKPDLLSLDGPGTSSASVVYIVDDLKKIGADRAEQHRGNIHYVAGDRANAYAEISPQRCFFSPKRLIALSDPRSLPVQTANGVETVEVSGRDAVACLVKSLQRAAQDRLPQRTEPIWMAVAVPVMFTPGRIAAMKQACKDAGARRVEHIYESDATLMYYLFSVADADTREARRSSKLRRRGSEHALVLDCGGTSINLTYAVLEENHEGRVAVNILARLGYQMGGNFIDWQIGEYFWPQAKDSSYFVTTGEPGLMDDPTRITLGVGSKWLWHRQRYWTMCEAAKKEVTSRLQTGHDQSHDWSPPLPPELGLTFKTTNEDLLGSIEVQEVYRKMGQILDDLKTMLADAGRARRVDTIILSGRSFRFAMLRETVIAAVGKTAAPGPDNISDAASQPPKPFAVVTLADDDADKTCVALGTAHWVQHMDTIDLTPQQALAHYGVIRMTSLKDGEFVPIIGAGDRFNNDGLITGMKTLDPLPHNGGKLRVCQIMGPRPDKAYADPLQRHKVSTVCTLRIGPSTRQPIQLMLALSKRDELRITAACGGLNYEHAEPVSVGDLLEDEDKSAHWLVLPKTEETKGSSGRR